jgi:hypothetical protein
MHSWLRHLIWFNRLVLAAATASFSTIAMRGLFNPVGSSAAHDILLGSSAGVTVARVAFGGFPLAFAVILLICLVSERRLLMGLSVLVIVSIVVTAARVLGIVLDGPAPFSMHVLKPEVGLILDRPRRSCSSAGDGWPSTETSARSFMALSRAEVHSGELPASREPRHEGRVTFRRLGRSYSSWATPKSPTLGSKTCLTRSISSRGSKHIAPLCWLSRIECSGTWGGQRISFRRRGSVGRATRIRSRRPKLFSSPW